MIWIDADACPGAVKEMVFRAARRKNLPVTLVANATMHVPTDGDFRFELVPASADAADHFIAERCGEGDLVITADVPLAARVVEKKATGLNPRGELYTAENVKQLLSIRNFMDEMRGAGMVTGGPAPLRNTDSQKFANALDRFLAKK